MVCRWITNSLAASHSGRPVAAPLVVAVLVLLSTIDPAASQTIPASPAAPTALEFPEVKQAGDAFQRGDVQAARNVLQSLVKQHPELAPADVYMSYLFLAAGRRAEAELSLDRAMVVAPDDPEAYLLLADLALRDRRRAYAAIAFERAEALLEKVDKNSHRLRVLSARLHAGSAAVAESREQYELAAKHLQQWMALSPKDPVPLGMLGRVRFLQKNYEEARDCFRQLLEKDKDAPPVELAMGRLYSDAGKFEEARKCMEAAIKAGGTDIRTRLTVADWALSAGLTDLAKENLRETLALDKTSVVAGVLSARLSRQNGNLSEAEAALRDLALRLPNSFLVTNELARTLAATAKQENWKSGLEYARRNFELHQRTGTDTALEAMMTYAWLLHRNGRNAEAEAALNLFPAGRTISPENTYFVASIYAETGKRDAAISALQVALSTQIFFPNRTDAEALLKKLRGVVSEKK